MFTLVRSCCSVCILLLLPAFFLQAQTALDNIKPKLFTLRNSRVTVGFLIHGNGIDKDARTPIFQVRQATLPNEDLSVTFPTQDLPYYGGGLYLDWFSPNSQIGLTLGGEYNAHAFSIESDQSRMDYEVNNITVPVYLKFRFGSVHSKSSLFLLTGAYYSMPIASKRLQAGVEESIDEIRQPAYGLSAVLGYQLKFTKSEAEEMAASSLAKNPDQKFQAYTEYPRAWLFVRTDHMLQSLFDESSAEQLIPGLPNTGLDFRTTNFSVGVAIFFGGKLRIK